MFQLHIDDAIQFMKSYTGQKFDAIVTDPPYGIGLHANQWDQFQSNQEYLEWTAEWADAALNIIKPGGHMAVFGAARLYFFQGVGIQKAGWEIRDCLHYLYGSGFPKSHNLKDDLGEKNGWGTTLKPAYEPIILARAALAGSTQSTFDEYSTGALNIDATRLENGNWPANILIDQDVADLLGDKSSYFYTSKVSTNERESGLDDFELMRRGDGRNAESARPALRTNYRKNYHPSVKPIDLMQWLCRLIVPKGGTLLDPFVGSGSTIIAAQREGMNAVGVEINEKYAEIASARIEYWSKQPHIKSFF